MESKPTPDPNGKIEEIWHQAVRLSIQEEDTCFKLFIPSEKQIRGQVNATSKLRRLMTSNIWFSAKVVVTHLGPSMLRLNIEHTQNRAPKTAASTLKSWRRTLSAPNRQLLHCSSKIMRVFRIYGFTGHAIGVLTVYGFSNAAVLP